MKSSKKLRLWVLSRGRIPTSHTAHKVYRWVDAEGRPTTPPPDPFEQKSRGDSNRVLNEADERKVCYRKTDTEVYVLGIISAWTSLDS